MNGKVFSFMNRADVSSLPEGREHRERVRFSEIWRIDRGGGGFPLHIAPKAQLFGVAEHRFVLKGGDSAVQLRIGTVRREFGGVLTHQTK